MNAIVCSGLLNSVLFKEERQISTETNSSNGVQWSIKKVLTWRTFFLEEGGSTTDGRGRLFCVLGFLTVCKKLRWNSDCWVTGACITCNSWIFLSNGVSAVVGICASSWKTVRKRDNINVELSSNLSGREFVKLDSLKAWVNACDLSYLKKQELSSHELLWLMKNALQAWGFYKPDEGFWLVLVSMNLSSCALSW